MRDFITVPKNKFGVNERVYHVTKDSDEGVILDAKFCLAREEWIYDVTFAPYDGGIELYERELSYSKYF